MSAVRERTVAFLIEERAGLMAQVDEVDMLLDLLDVKPPAPREEEPPEAPPPPRPKLNGHALRANTPEAAMLTRSAVLEALKDAGYPLTVAQVAQRVGVKVELAGVHLRGLLDDGRVTRKPVSMVGKHFGGRAPFEYELVVKEHHLDTRSRLVID